MNESFTVKVSMNGSDYTATVNGSRVKITKDSVHVGTGRWCFKNHRIADCPANLGEDVYNALDAAILLEQV